jgi:hypothetical protein
MRELPQTAPLPGTSTVLPDTHAPLEEVGALYPVVAYWTVDEDDSNPAAPGSEIDEDVLDETIFAGLISLR